MSIVAKELLENKDNLEKEIEELFQQIDVDGSNEIEKKEFREFMKKLDKDKSGTINLEEFRDYAIKILKALSEKK